jgi:alanyl-tRNA synthetase
MAAERGLTVDTEGFKALMENDRNISKADTQAKKGGGSKDLTMAAEQTSHLQVAGVSPTESDLKYQWNNVPIATV